MPLLSMLFGAMALPPVPEVTVPEASRAGPLVEKCRGYLERAAAATEAGPRSSALAAAERTCVQIRRRDPAIDPTPLEAYLQLLRDDLVAMQDEAKQQGDRETRVRRGLATLATPVSTSWSSPADNERIEAEVRTYEDLGRQVREDLAALPARPAELETWKSTWLREAEQLDGEISRLRAALQDRTFPDHAWNEALALRARFWVGQTLWPEEPALESALARIEAFQTQLGSREGAQALRQAAHDAAARATKMPPAAAHDATVEGQIRSAFDAQGWGEEVLAVHLQSSSWSVVTDGTGAVVGRTRSAWIAARKPDGRCLLYDYTVYQPRSGAGWGGVRRKSHASRGIAPENIES